MKCPYCGTEITKKPVAIGVYAIPDFENNKQMVWEGNSISLGNMRPIDLFLPLAMYECNHCNLIFFTPSKNIENLTFTLEKISPID